MQDADVVLVFLSRRKRRPMKPIRYRYCSEVSSDHMRKYCIRLDSGRYCCHLFVNNWKFVLVLVPVTLLSLSVEWCGLESGICTGSNGNCLISHPCCRIFEWNPCCQGTDRMEVDRFGLRSAVCVTSWQEMRRLEHLVSILIFDGISNFIFYTEVILGRQDGSW